ncbi:tetratricopeptide repeat protein [Corynebacterium halotolerans]|uniref:tetratricopeptide repeat protein n=1 Tax=Corynebacterium halotolerans TaxID=225326 RepID=UPI003CF6EF7E
MTTPDRFASGAVDLGQIKARAEARSQSTPAGAGQAAGESTPAGAVAPFFTVTPDNLETDVLRRSLEIPVVVLVGTSRSPDSEQLKQDFETLAREAELAFVFGYVDADTSPDIAQMMGVSGLPTVLALAAGRPVTNFEGGQPMEALRKWTASLTEAVGSQLQGLPEGTVMAGGAAPEPQEPPSDPRFDAATDALNAGDFAAAIQVYDDILAAEPKNAEAKQARDSARLLARLSETPEGVDPVMAADEDPTDVDKAFAAADREIAAGDPDAAFGRLIALLGTSAGDVRTTVRDRLVELFALFDAADPRVLDARRRMASALY